MDVIHDFDCSGLASTDPSCSTFSSDDHVIEEIIIEIPEQVGPPINFRGWELFYTSIENQLKHKADIIMAMIHWLLMLKKFHFYGIKVPGKTPVFEPYFDEISEHLPDGWNDLPSYGFYYNFCDVIYFLQGTAVSVGVICVRFVSTKKQTMSYMCVDFEDMIETIHASRGCIEQIMPKFYDFMNRVFAELIYPICFRENKIDRISQTVDYKTTKKYRNIIDDIKGEVECDEGLRTLLHPLPYNPAKRLILLPKEMVNRNSGLTRNDDIPEVYEGVKFFNWSY